MLEKISKEVSHIKGLLEAHKPAFAAKPFHTLASAVFHSLGGAKFAEVLRWIAENHSPEEAEEVEAVVRHLGISQELNSALSVYRTTLQSKPALQPLPPQSKSKPEGKKKGQAARNESQVSIPSSSEASFTNTDNVYTENPIDPENMQPNKIIDATLSEHAGP